MGCRGWSYEDVLPLFRKSESYQGHADDKFRGRGGPMNVETYRTVLPATHRFVAAAQEAGIPYNQDYNGAVQDGVSYSQNSRRGRFRHSTAQTFLTEARSRPNLRIETDALVRGLVFDGKRCTGVRFRRGEQEIVVTAAREVILSA